MAEWIKILTTVRLLAHGEYEQLKYYLCVFQKYLNIKIASENMILSFIVLKRMLVKYYILYIFYSICSNYCRIKIE